MRTLTHRKIPLIHIFHPTRRDKEIVPLLSFFAGEDIFIDVILFDENDKEANLTDTNMLMSVKQRYFDKEPLFSIDSLGENSGIKFLNASKGLFRINITEKNSSKLTAGLKLFWLDWIHPHKSRILVSFLEISSIDRDFQPPVLRSV